MLRVLSAVLPAMLCLPWQGLVAEHEDPPLDATTARQLLDYVEAQAH